MEAVAKGGVDVGRRSVRQRFQAMDARQIGERLGKNGDASPFLFFQT